MDMDYLLLLWVAALMWALHSVGEDIHELAEQEEEIEEPEESEDYDGKSKESEDKEEIS